MRTCWHRRFFSAATEVSGPWSIEQLEKQEKVWARSLGSMLHVVITDRVPAQE